MQLLEQETVASLMNGFDCTNMNSWGVDLSSSLKEYIMQGNRHNCVVHCFTGSLDELQCYVDMGCFIGLTGHIFTLPVDTLQDMLQIIPLDKLVIETDAPYMGFKGCRESEDKARSRKYPNVPAALPKIAEYIAEVMDTSFDVICAETTKNGMSFFHSVK
jgi:TatD DNase family protein